MAVAKFPPPPDMGRDNQKLNRWLIEIQRILNAGGTIDPANVDGLVAAYAQIAANVIELAAIEIHLTTIDGHLTTIDGHLTTIDGQITAINVAAAALAVRVTALEARNQVLNGAGVPGAGTGVNGDLYINNIGAPGTNLYAKIAGVWVAFA